MRTVALTDQAGGHRFRVGGERNVGGCAGGNDPGREVRRDCNIRKRPNDVPESNDSFDSQAGIWQLTLNKMCPVLPSAVVVPSVSALSRNWLDGHQVPMASSFQRAMLRPNSLWGS